MGFGGGVDLPLPLVCGLALGLGLPYCPWGGGAPLRRYSRSGGGGFLSWGPWGGGFGALGWGVFSPLLVLVLLLLLLLLLLLSSPPRSCNLPQPLRRGSMPPALLPASHLPKPYSTERAKLGFVPNIRLNSVTPTRRVRPPPSRHSTRTLRGSAAHLCTPTT